MWRDYEATELSLRAHPFSFIRPYLDPTQIDTAQSLKQDSFTTRNNRISVAGRVLFRQRPRTAKGTVFLTIEDETAVANLILRSHVFKQYTDIALHSSWIIAHGTLQRSESVVYVSVQRLEDLQTRGLSEAFTREAFTRDTAPIKYTRYKYT